MSRSTARSRKSGSSRKRTSASKRRSTSSAETFVCPECGKTFATAQGLGAHRSRAHGVAGTSRSATGTRAARKTGTKTGGSRKRGAASQARKSGTKTAFASRPAAASSPPSADLDRDRLLSTLFPGGLPAKTSVIAAVGRWLDDAERLARMR
jgi:hypothetical protein